VAALLAAIAAAAMASGAVRLPVAAGTFAGATATGMMTATGVGVVTAGVACCDEAAESAATVVSEDDFWSVLLAPAFVALDFALDCWTAAALASVLALAVAAASDACWALAFWSSDALFVAGAAEASGCLLALALAGVSLAEGCGAGCGCVFDAELPVSAGRLESTSEPKLSLCCDGSGRGSLDCAA